MCTYTWLHFSNYSYVHIFFLYIFFNLEENSKINYALYYTKKRWTICDGTYSHSLQIVFVALAQFTGDHGLGFAHVVDRALNRNDALEIETIDVVDTADGDFRIGVLHNSLDCVTALTDNPTDEIVMREDLQGDLTVNVTM